MKKTSIGGQAVMEGVMMKNLDRYAVAVRKPDHEIEVMTDEYKSLGSRYAVLGLPIIRGVVNFGESLYIGLKTLSYSSSFYEEEDYEPGKVEQFFTKIFGDKLESVLMGITMEHWLEIFRQRNCFTIARYHSIWFMIFIKK